MANSCAALEFPVAELACRPPGTLYAIRFRGRASGPVGERLRRYWQLAWDKAGPAPPLTILDDLEPRLANEEFRAVGLLRIEAGQ